MTLKTETNTEEMGNRVIKAFSDQQEAFKAKGLLLPIDPGHDAVQFFNHGHWWITCLDCSRFWLVHDAEGGDSIDGFDFEEVN